MIKKQTAITKLKNMKTQSKLLIAIVVAAFMLACNKDSKEIANNPQLPGEYFPAFPNTWWNYRMYNDEIIKYEISEKYMECEGKMRPIFLNIDKCIQGESLMYGYTAPGSYVVVESPIYSLDINRVLVCPISFSTFKETVSMGPPVEDISYRRVLITKDTNLIINNDTFNNVIIIKEYSLHDSTHLYLDYFAKEIGLIKRDRIMTIDTATQLVTIMTLDNYHIEK